MKPQDRENHSMKITLTATTLAAFVCLAGQGAAETPPTQGFQVVMDSYTQEFTIEFAGEAEAGKAAVEMTPLYRGYEWAISSRWDDNRWTDLEMKRVLEKHGYKGTWYLNESGKNYFGPDYGLLAGDGGSANIGKRLLTNGFSIGGHTLGHPWLEALNRNRIWWEIMGIRVDRESETDKPILSFGTPFGFTKDVTAGKELLDNIDELTGRAGYYHGSGPESFVKHSWLPGDGEDIDGEMAKYLADPAVKAKNPGLCLGYHVVYTTPEGWARFEAQLVKYERNPKWWYCNWNEYAAYRWQFLHTLVKTERLGGGRLKVSLSRPELIELNDAVPLTFVIRGVEPRTVKEIRGKGAVEKLQPIGGAYAFNLGHDTPRALPAKIDRLATGEGIPAEFPFLSASLTRRGNELALNIGNTGDKPLQDVRLVYRLPPAYKNGLVKRKLGDIKATASIGDALALDPPRDEWEYQAGESRYVAQVDFISGGEPGRLYIVLTEPETGGDPSFPRGRFYVMGPLPEKTSEARSVAAAMSKPKGRTTVCRVETGRSYAWERATGPRADWIGPEIIMTAGDAKSPNDKPYHYLLLTSLDTDKARQARLVGQSNGFPAVYLNGKEISGDMLDLRKGGNDLLLLYSSGGDNFSPRHYGAFLRLTDPQSGDRLKGIAYRPEQVKLKEGEITLASGTGPVAKVNRLVFDDFEDGDMFNLAGTNGITDSNGDWVLSYDEFSGSTAQAMVAKDSRNKTKGAMHIFGFRGRNNPSANKWSWATLAGAISAQSSSGKVSNLVGSKGIAFRARSDKSTKAEMHVQVIWKGRDLSKNGSSPRAGFETGPEWRDYTVYWEDFNQPPWLCPGESCTGPLASDSILSITVNFPVDGADLDLWLDDVEIIYGGK
jgi:hypothetical protein